MVAPVNVKTSPQESFNHGTRIFWHSGSGRQHACNVGAFSMHRDTTTSHSDVSHPRSETASSQQEAIDPFMSDSVLSQFGSHTLVRGEQVKLQTENSMDRPVTVPANISDPTKLSHQETDLADSMLDWPVFDSENEVMPGKYKAESEESTTFTLDLNQCNSSTGAASYFRTDEPSGFFSRKPSRDAAAAASANGYRRSSITSDRELSVNGGRNLQQWSDAAANDLSRHDADRWDSQTQWRQLSEAESSMADNSFRHHGSVTKSEKLHGWSSTGTSHRCGNLLPHVFFVISTLYCNNYSSSCSTGLTLS